MKMEVFNNAEFGSVRTAMVNGEVMFVGKDVATILGYANSSKALADHVDDEDKLNNESLSSLGQRGGWLINESGLYSLILSSKLPSAKKFKRWVTSEVLPAIRKHGLYAIDDIINNPDMAIAALQALKEERAKRLELEETVAVQNQQMLEMKPKVTYYDKVLSCTNSIPITIIAKDFGMHARQMNEYLHEKKVQFKIGNTWVLYQNHANKGYTETKTIPITTKSGKAISKTNTYWTQKGRLFIYELLKSDGILPEIETEE